MICKNCNNTIADDARFCGFCGTKVEREPVMAGAPAPVPTPVEQPAPVPTPVESAAPVPAPAEQPAPVPTPVEQPAPVPAPVEQPAPVPTPVESAAPVPAPAEQPAPVPTPVESAAPVPAPVESAAPVPVSLGKSESAPAMEAPAAAVVSPAAAVTQPAAAVTQPTAAVTQPAAAVKKKAPVVPIIIAALAVILVIAGTLVYFFGRSTVTRLFMGKERYAVSLVTDYVEDVAQTDPIISTIVKNGTSSTGLANAADADALGSLMQGNGSASAAESGAQLAGALAELAGAQGVTVDLSASVEPDKRLTEAFGDDADLMNAVFGLINSAELSASAKTGDSTQLALTAKTNGSEIVTANVYIAEDGSVYTTLPGILDKPVLTKTATAAAEDESEQPAEITEIDREKLSKVYGRIIKAWEAAYKNGEFTYEKAEFTVGDAEHEKTFKGTRVSVSLSQEDLCGLLLEIYGAVNDDSYIEELVEAYGGDVSAFHDNLDDRISAIEDMADNDELALRFTIDSYVTAANKPCGVEISMSFKSSGEKQSVVFSSLSAGGNTEISVSSNKTKQLQITSTRTGADSGIFEAEVNTSTTGKKLVGARIEYKNLKTENVLGTDVITGNFVISANVKALKDDLSYQTFNVGDETLDLYTVLSKSTLTIDSAKDGDGVKLTLGADVNKLGTASLNLGIKPAADFSTIPASTDDVYAESDLGNPEIQLSALAYLKEKMQGDSNLDTVFTALGLGASDIDEQIEALHKDMEFYEHYSAYDPNVSGETAYLAVDSLYDAFYSDSDFAYTAINGRTFTLKLYFDKDGKLSVIDPDGFSYNWDTLFAKCECCSVYAEITVMDGYLKGICTVLTDDPADLPSKLPNAFNYIDGVFEYDSHNDSYKHDGTKDSFVMSSSPDMSIGESTTEKAVAEAEAEVSDYNDYAEKISKTFNRFMEMHNAQLRQDTYGYCELSISESGSWSWGSNWTPLEYIFTESLYEYDSQLLDMLGEACNLKSAYVRLFFADRKLAGVVVTDSWSNYINTMDFVIGSTSRWTYANGIVITSDREVYAHGTYPVLPKPDNAARTDKALDAMTGTWLLIYNSKYDVDKTRVSLSKDDLKSAITSNSIVSTYDNNVFIYNSNGETILEMAMNYDGYMQLTYFTDPENYEYCTYTRDLNY